MLTKTAIIKKLPGSNKYRLYSKKKGPDGKRRNLGTYDTLAAVKEREKQIQFFKHHAEDGEIDDKNAQTIKRLSDIAVYLDEAGFKKPSYQVYALMDLLDDGLNNEDCIVDMFVNTDEQTNVGGPGGSPLGISYNGSISNSPSFGVDSAVLRGHQLVSALIKIANALDEKGLYDEADALDQEVDKMIRELEATQALRKTQQTERPEKPKQKEEAVARSNGRDGSSMVDNGGSGMGQGFAGGFTQQYSNLEGAFGPSDNNF